MTEEDSMFWSVAQGLIDIAFEKDFISIHGKKKYEIDAVIFQTDGKIEFWIVD